MLNIIKKSFRPISLQSLRGVANVKKTPLPMMKTRQMSSLLPRRVNNMSLLPQMSEFNDFERGLPSLLNSFFLRPTDMRSPLSLDFYETDKEYHLKCDVPGFKKEEVKVEWDDDFLIIQAEHAEGSPTKESRDVRYHICERSQSQAQMYRKLRMPSDANMDEVSANFNHGILSIDVPKVENIKKEIRVSSSDE